MSTIPICQYFFDFGEKICFWVLSFVLPLTNKVYKTLYDYIESSYLIKLTCNLSSCFIILHNFKFHYHVFNIPSKNICAI